ncbi:MAG: DUF99 domain-containing protein [Thermoplasmata archaeon]|nr:MAG: DUF99 domain-containing protein [Thermoplasmata archaeon]
MLHLDKRGIRVLGIAESFTKGRKKAALAGVVMRGDLQIDGFAFSKITLGGIDATRGVIEIFQKLNRSDINAIILNGCIISLFNIIDLEKVHDITELPLLCVTYEESPGIEKYLRDLDNSEFRLRLYQKLGKREEIWLHTGKKVFVRYLGMKKKEASALLNKFTLQGSIPEPLRVARLLARAINAAFPKEF